MGLIPAITVEDLTYRGLSDIRKDLQELSQMMANLAGAGFVVTSPRGSARPYFLKSGKQPEVAERRGGPSLLSASPGSQRESVLAVSGGIGRARRGWQR